MVKGLRERESPRKKAQVSDRTSTFMHGSNPATKRNLAIWSSSHSGQTGTKCSRDLGLAGRPRQLASKLAYKLLTRSELPWT